MDSQKFNTDGILVTIDLVGCEFEILNCSSFLCHQAKLAVQKAGMQVLAISIVPFKPQGLSLALILGESHLTIHTSPEHCYAAIDIFTCGKGDPMVAATYLLNVFKPKHFLTKRIDRGVKCLIVEDKLEAVFQSKEVDHASR